MIAALLGAPWVKPVGILLVVLAIAGAGAWVNGTRWESKYNLLLNECTTFKGGVAALGHEAEARNAKQALNDLKAKERVDEQNRLDHDRAIRTIIRLRRDADRARGSFVPSAGAGARRPDLACFDRAALESALREFVTEVRRFVDEGTAATIDLDAAKLWEKAR